MRICAQLWIRCALQMALMWKPDRCFCFLFASLCGDRFLQINSAITKSQNPRGSVAPTSQLKMWILENKEYQFTLNFEHRHFADVGHTLLSICTKHFLINTSQIIMQFLMYFKQTWQTTYWTPSPLSICNTLLVLILKF